jgi:hypothetical protein
MRLPWWGWRRSLRLAGIAQHESMVASIGKSVSCCPTKIRRFQTLRPDSKMQEQTLMSSQSIVIIYRLYGMLYGQYVFDRRNDATVSIYTNRWKMTLNLQFCVCKLWMDCRGCPLQCGRVPNIK